MPPDPTTRTTSRRPQRKITEEEQKEIELKRIKGILSAGQGTRFILADTDQLHKKIADMSHRIRQLEDALAILQSTVSNQRHPLLDDDLLKVKFGPEATDARHTQSTGPSTIEQNMSQSIDALGTLTLGDSGDVKYFGRSAGSEAGEESDDDESDEETSHAPMNADTEGLSKHFPFTTSKHSTCTSVAFLESQLPSQERAYTLGDSYLKHASNFFRPIKRDELFESFLPGIYAAAAARRSESETPGSPPEIAKAGPGSRGVTKNSPHALATIFFLFALGALLDLSLPPYNSEAEHYYELGCSALGLRSVYDSPQMDTVQAMGLMATYHCFAGKRFHRDSAWCVMSFAVKLAQGIGLHRDSARWKMDPKTVQKRRTLFWEVFTADVSHSLALGRPPAMHLSYIDCEFPIDEEATLSDKGEVQNGFWRMKYTFGRDLFLAVSEATLVAKSSSYSTILELDRKVREISFPTSFKPYVTREDGDELYYSSSHSLQGFYASQHRTVTMIYLHRSFFAQAMLDHPTNPLLSPFAPSLLTALRSASIIIRATAHQFDRCAEMAMRVWFLMLHTFSAAIIVGTVVTRSPNSDMAPGALQDLCRAVELFERTALQSQRAKIALGVLHRLKEKAVRVFTQHKSNTLPIQPSTSPAMPSLRSINVDDGDDDLAIFGGQARVVSRKSRQHRRATPSSGASNSPSPPADGLSSAGAQTSDLPPFTPPTQPGPSLPVFTGSPSPYHGSMGVSSPSQYTSNSNGSGASNSMGLSLSPSMGQTTNEEMYGNYMGYPAAQKPTAGSPVSDPILHYQYTPGPGGPQGFPDLQEWRDLSPDPTGLPKADTSYNWQPQHTYNQHQHQHQQRQQPAMFIPTTAATRQSQQTMPDAMMQSSYTSPPNGHSFFAGYEPPPVSTGYDSSSSMVTDPTEALLELGLMRGSDIDSGWLSYMQDCGIMDTASRSQASLSSSAALPNAS
ncbi:hypothetical protein H0H92_012509 [Tricholoma furcatifolium]|nr:hypothetical protein H0H92_012509 [Tricholoma furcatifolium]